MKIRNLEDTVAEFEDFLKQNPDVKQLRDLKRQINVGERRIHELETWIERNDDVRIEKTRIIELEKMVTHLEEYVKSHDVDALKQKLQDREERIDQLHVKIESLQKEIMRHESPKMVAESQDIKQDAEAQEIASLQGILCDKTQKMKEMEHAISEKDNRIQEYEQKVLEWQDKVVVMMRRMEEMEKEISEYEAEDIGVLKEEIRVRDEKVQQLEDEIDSLERAFGERIDLEQIEELLNVIKERDEREKQLEKILGDERKQIDELKEALRGSVIITSEGERKLKQSEKSKRSAIDRVRHHQ